MGTGLRRPPARERCSGGVLLNRRLPAADDLTVLAGPRYEGRHPDRPLVEVSAADRSLTAAGLRIVNAVDPGWIPTKMGWPNATGRLDDGVTTQVWLATSDDPAATVSGHYFFDLRQRDANPAASDPPL